MAGLFGPTPQELAAAQRQLQLENNFASAQLGPAAQAGLDARNTGSLLGGAAADLMGLTDPQQALAARRQAMKQQILAASGGDPIRALELAAQLPDPEIAQAAQAQLMQMQQAQQKLNTSSSRRAPVLQRSGSNSARGLPTRIWVTRWQ